MINKILNNNSSNFSLYIHFPWCIKKCFYCDFNSYTINKKHNNLEENYLKKLCIDFDNSFDFLLKYQKTNLISIFFGGGTPSLLSGKSIEHILNYINKKIVFNKDIEISLEVNPATIEQDSMDNYKQAGVTRISLGVQSFQDLKLKLLGRVHQSQDVKNTLYKIIRANFNSFNIDLMYGLPVQSVLDSLYDLNTALSYDPKHISWYQLTLEPNTLFFNKPPINLPTEDTIWEIYNQGSQLLKHKNYINYEISAFAKPGYYCVHNMNYWQYGDFLGIGAGAHSKLSMLENVSKFNSNSKFTKKLKVLRLSKVKNPKNYLNCEVEKLIDNQQCLSKPEIIFEFMLNNLRLKQGFCEEDFFNKTQCGFDDIKQPLNKSIDLGLLQIDKNFVRPTELGRKFLNNLQELFLPNLLE